MLYVVGTPIGNLDDLSIRQAKTICASDIILAEDTRSAGHLLSEIKKRFGLTAKSLVKLLSYYKEKEFEKLPQILDLLNQGLTISLISESGMPGISDPGQLLLQTLIKRNIPFEVIPGPSAVTTSLLYAGFPSDPFLFIGFLPKKQSEILQLFNRLENINKQIKRLSVVFFESPNRIAQTIQLIHQKLPDASITLCREMTKMHEEIIRDKEKLMEIKKLKGEIAVVLALH